MDFQGFQISYPAVLIVVAVCVFIGLSWLAYRNKNNIPPVPRFALMALRALSLIILLLLLMNPFFYSSREKAVPPKIAILLDNSESAGITKGDYKGRDSYDSLLQSLNFESLDDAELEYYLVGEQTVASSPDSLNTSEPQTNLSTAVNTILELDEEVKAAVLISDGIITYGKNPVFNATFSSIPVYTIALGDTSKVKDISVSNVLTNSTGYTNTNHVIETEISQSGYKGSTVTVSLLSGEEVLQKKQLSFDTDDQTKNIEFNPKLEKEGLKQYKINIKPVEGEWTEANNSSSFSIDVLDSKVRILDVAFEIHPDVKTIRSIIETDINNELTTLTWLGGNRFVEDLPEQQDFNLVIIHGAPGPAQSFDFIEELENIPLIYFGTSSSLTKENSFLEDVRLIQNESPQTAIIRLHKTLNANEHTVLELPAINLEETPQLISPRQTALQNPQSTTLFSSVYNDVETNQPVISVLELGNIRRSQVYAWNWFKMYQSTNSAHRKFTTTLITNLISWTSSNPDNRNLQISPTKQTFTTFEKPAINASLRNESGLKESDAIIEVTISSENGTTRTFNMESSGNGNYSLNLPRLSQGLYNYRATAGKGNRVIDEQQGEFLVSNSSSELTNTMRNDKLLRSLALNTGGDFFSYSEVSGFWDSLKTAGVLQSHTQTVENYAFPVRSIFWFVLVILLLGTEWMGRKYFSLP